MTLKELEDGLSKARENGATDATLVYLNHKKWTYMRAVSAVEFQKRESWPSKEWPVVILSKP